MQLLKGSERGVSASQTFAIIRLEVKRKARYKMNRLAIGIALAVLSLAPAQVEAKPPHPLPRGAHICHKCDGDGWVRCGFLYFDTKRCHTCDGRGYILPPPPPKPHPGKAPHHVAPKPPPPPKGKPGKEPPKPGR